MVLGRAGIIAKGHNYEIARQPNRSRAVGSFDAKAVGRAHKFGKVCAAEQRFCAVFARALKTYAGKDLFVRGDGKENADR